MVNAGVWCPDAIPICGGGGIGSALTLDDDTTSYLTIPYTPVVVGTQCDNFCGTVTCDGICFGDDVENCLDVTFEQCGRVTSLSLQGGFAGTIALCRASPTKVDSALWDHNLAFQQISVPDLCEQRQQRTFSPSDVASIYFDIPDVEPKYVNAKKVRIEYVDPFDGPTVVVFRNENGLVDTSSTHPWINYREISKADIQTLWPNDHKDFAFFITPGRLNVNLKMTIFVTLEISTGSARRFRGLDDSETSSSDFTKEITITPTRPVVGSVNTSKLGYVLRGETYNQEGSASNGVVPKSNNVVHENAPAAEDSNVVTISVVLASLFVFSVIGAGAVYMFITRRVRNEPRRVNSNAESEMNAKA
jgi:hypothetical protein